jgi:penicillin amidase
MRWIYFLLSFILTILFIWFLSVPNPKAPIPLGKFLDPCNGFWRLAEGEKPDFPESLSFPELGSPVEVVFDERRVPHIFGSKQEDIAFVQGYLTARDRLWQMEFQVYAASGRLSELIGRGEKDAVLNLDRQNRRKGMVFAAEQTLAALEREPEVKPILDAYVAGVNAWINRLRPRDYPLEYRLMNYRPEPWTVLKTALLLKYMANTLTGGTDDIEYTQALQLWGEPLFDRLYPERPFDESQIIPDEGKLDFVPLPSPVRPPGYHPDSLIAGEFPLEKPVAGYGSNNWAVSGARSTTGNPILCNDPHLSLNLPSLWYELQLHTPEQNVYGVSLPGAPGIVIGFNDSIAWGMTNAGRDVLDFFRISWKDDRREEYLLAGRWEKAQTRIEAFRIKGEGMYYDTVKYTQLGPVMYDARFGENISTDLAIRWMAHEPSLEAKTILKLNQAKNYSEYLKAISYFDCPAQNFVFSSSKGDIAIWQMGKFVLKWPEQGRFLLEAADSAQLWNAYIPKEQNPHILNPVRGFVSSANQLSTSVRYPYYYNGGFESFRNRRLNTLLSGIEPLSAEDMKRIQLDNYSMAAADILPLMLSEFDAGPLSDVQQAAYDKVRKWDYFYGKDSEGAVIFDSWWNQLYDMIWQDEFMLAGSELSLPGKDATIILLRDSLNFSFYKDVRNGNTPNRKTLINQAFLATVESLVTDYDPNPDHWKWGAFKGTTIRHIARIEPLGRQVDMGGGKNILNASSKHWGPSWRMIVQLGDEPKAFGVYPGGQSGNPGSRYYDNFVNDWANGSYYRLWYMKNAEDRREKPLFRQVFSQSQP